MDIYSFSGGVASSLVAVALVPFVRVWLSKIYRLTGLDRSFRIILEHPSRKIFDSVICFDICGDSFSKIAQDYMKNIVDQEKV